MSENEETRNAAQPKVKRATMRKQPLQHIQSVPAVVVVVVEKGEMQSSEARPSVVAWQILGVVCGDGWAGESISAWLVLCLCFGASEAFFLWVSARCGGPGIVHRCGRDRH